MAIHHDSHAYGNLEKLRSDLDEETLLSDVAALNEQTKEETSAKNEEKTPKKTLDKSATTE